MKPSPLHPPLRQVYTYERADGVGRAADLVLQGFIRFSSLSILPAILSATLVYFMVSNSFVYAHTYTCQSFCTLDNFNTSIHIHKPFVHVYAHTYIVHVCNTNLFAPSMQIVVVVRRLATKF